MWGGEAHPDVVQLTTMVLLATIVAKCALKYCATVVPFRKFQFMYSTVRQLIFQRYTPVTTVIPQLLF